MKYGSDFHFDNNDMSIKEYALISQVAHMYYNLDMQQPEISKKMFFSRSKVSRMLKKARELEIVEIKVKRILDRAASIEQKLKSLFPIKEAIIVSTFDEDSSDVLDIVTNFAAIYLSSLLKGNCILGVSRGNTITQVAQKLTKVHECKLHTVQLMGSTAHPDASAESRELVNTVSNKYAGMSHYLNTPLYVDDLYAKEVLMRDRTVHDTFDLMRKCDIVITGLGGFNAKVANPNWFGYLTEKHLAELDEKSAAGSICSQFFDVNGMEIECEWNKKCIAFPFEYINKTSLTVVVASGTSKVDPILGALRGQLLGVLITDAKTALSVIEKQEQLLLR